MSESYSEDEFIFMRAHLTDEESPLASASSRNENKRNPNKNNTNVDKTKDYPLFEKKTSLHRSPKTKARQLKDSPSSPKTISKFQLDLPPQDLGVNYFNMALKPGSKQGKVKVSTLITKHDILYKKKEDDFHEKDCFDEKILIVTLYLPVKVFRNADGKGWEVRPQKEYHEMSFVTHLFMDEELTGQAVFKNLLWVGMLQVDVEDPEEKESLKQLLLKRYHCLPIFQQSQIREKFVESRYFKEFETLKDHTFSHKSQVEYVLKAEDDWSVIEKVNEDYARVIMEEFCQHQVHGYMVVMELRLIFVVSSLNRDLADISCAVFFPGAFPSQNNFQDRKSVV